MTMGNFGQGLHIRAGAGRGFSMYEGDDSGVGVGLDRLLQLVRINGATPFVLDHDRLAAAAFNVLLHAAAENTILADDDLVTGLYKIDKTHFHAG